MPRTIQIIAIATVTYFTLYAILAVEDKIHEEDSNTPALQEVLCINEKVPRADLNTVSFDGHLIIVSFTSLGRDVIPNCLMHHPDCPCGRSK